MTPTMCVSASACQLSSYVAVIYLCLGLQGLHVHSQLYAIYSVHVQLRLPEDTHCGSFKLVELTYVGTWRIKRRRVFTQKRCISGRLHNCRLGILESHFSPLHLSPDHGCDFSYTHSLLLQPLLSKLQDTDTASFASKPHGMC